MLGHVSVPAPAALALARAEWVLVVQEQGVLVAGVDHVPAERQLEQARVGRQRTQGRSAQIAGQPKHAKAQAAIVPMLRVPVVPPT